ncbi:MAG: GTP 3',8-cyclase MoaA [Pseudomonadota bacterium]|nr:GTP 3',8-cyclase MoaA [Pseudomonadota bacterium]MDP2352600.1 GTP 3',8-cyclase MoaA [Pseudomonadota bacterium]
MIDGHGRRIDYLRVSVTERCNYRCFYCMPDGTAPCSRRAETLTTAELTRLVALFAALGVRKVRLTGGEPLVRRDLPELVAGLRNLPGIEDLSLSTNGHLLAAQAAKLKAAGLDRVNVSLDTLDPAIFAGITGQDAVAHVLAGIEAARAAGLTPIKVNTVVLKGVNDSEIEPLLDYAVVRGLELRFIESMPMGAGSTLAERHFYPAEAILERVRTYCGADLIPVKGGRGAGPARYYQMGAGPARVGVISAVSQHFCASCNRVRLTATGDLILCMGQEGAVPLGGLMRAGASDPELRAAILAGIARKPERHDLATTNSPHTMFMLGG